MRLARFHRSALAALAIGLLASAAAFARDTVAEGSFDRTLKVSGAIDLTVSTGSGSITVRTGSASEIHVVGKIRINSGWHTDDRDAQARVHRIESNPPIEQNGSIVRIGEIQDEDLKRNVSISYELVVPPDTKLRSETGSGSQELDGVHGPVEATTGSGSLHIGHIGAELHASTGSGTITLDTIQGSVRATTGSGSIRADGVAGGLVAQTGSGEIELAQTAPGDVDVQTGSGGIELRGVRGRVSARSGSGSIHVDGSPTGEWRLHTSSGGVTLRLPADAGFELDANAGSGNIETSHELLVSGTLGHHELHGKAHGGGPLISVSTSSGTIRVE
jgi:hypothetical protein